ncbi:hypothetical protein [Streptomyces cylindrosporus]|uniref:Uncharacterized protein n=1 Tax=Streptomyces cylindrosporus TaxID=2927583 RepID=A0ABS9Y4J9_9ACTN|nr:hypothetical protein [Streptomyces cylindrosporus]MCI3272124.1 hypothetical protein [Streptomyces cylindrosporus]
MTERGPGQWPVDEPVDLDGVLEVVDLPHQVLDDLYVRRSEERALHEMVMDSIRHDLQQQPSPLTVVTAARNWCTRITAAAEEIARAKRSTA